MKKCVIEEEQVCNKCGECDLCDIDTDKTCDNCMKCLEIETDYKEIVIDKIITGNPKKLN